jgi:hypothetical protein
MTRSPRQNAGTVIFLHIGKTAGTTLGRIVRRHYSADETYTFAVARDARQVELPGLPVRPGGRLLHPPRETTLSTFAGIAEADREQYRLIMGHTVFGIHELLPQPSRYLTMLRHPRALVPSLYDYIRRTPTHYHHTAVTSNDMSLLEFVESGISIEADNSQVRAIAGDLETAVGACDVSMLEMATRHLHEYFPVVGITERFDESLIAMREAFGYRRLHYVRAKVTPRRARTGVLDPEVAELIERRNQFDVQLYEWAYARLDQWAARPTNRTAVNRFKRENAVYRPIGAATYALPKAAIEWTRSVRR